eukprot:7441711-Alexandrium_andersonii.AAC.1
MPEPNEPAADDAQTAMMDVATPTGVDDDATLGELMDQLRSSAPPGLASASAAGRSPKRGHDAGDELMGATQPGEDARDPLGAHWRAVQQPFDPAAEVDDDHAD